MLRVYALMLVYSTHARAALKFRRRPSRTCACACARVCCIMGDYVMHLHSCTKIHMHVVTHFLAVAMHLVLEGGQEGQERLDPTYDPDNPPEIPKVSLAALQEYFFMPETSTCLHDEFWSCHSHAICVNSPHRVCLVPRLRMHCTCIAPVLRMHCTGVADALHRCCGCIAPVLRMHCTRRRIMALCRRTAHMHTCTHTNHGHEYDRWIMKVT
jgi:hypothetical protein